MPATLFPCPYLGEAVELSEERERHIAERHPDFLPTYRGLISISLADPDQVRTSSRMVNAKMLSRWDGNLRGGNMW